MIARYCALVLLLLSALASATPVPPLGSAAIRGLSRNNGKFRDICNGRMLTSYLLSYQSITVISAGSIRGIGPTTGRPKTARLIQLQKAITDFSAASQQQARQEERALLEEKADG
ncbi:hypothetical protein DFJ73DRAFT_760687 [Zopfochytrium polystomum]|nr:hypothetical protein DFJ73DRAFT_760687 [Zopfochytrium polystomum]